MCFFCTFLRHRILHFVENEISARIRTQSFHLLFFFKRNVCGQFSFQHIIIFFSIYLIWCCDLNSFMENSWLIDWDWVLFDDCRLLICDIWGNFYLFLHHCVLLLSTHEFVVHEVFVDLWFFIALLVYHHWTQSVLCNIGFCAVPIECVGCEWVCAM